MATLPIDALCEFSEIILGALETAGAREIVEIGAGGMSAMLADHARGCGGHLVSVDPAPRQDFIRWAGERPDVKHIALTSLEAFPELANVDAWVIDGDHNWYTVYNELRQIDALSRRDGRPLLAIVHGVSWPTGRRDTYHAPDQVPAEFRRASSFEGGATLDSPTLDPDCGFRSRGQFALALEEGGPRNGVLTAIEDFLAEQRDVGREWGFAEIAAGFGLAILFDLDAEWTGRVAELVLPHHLNKLLGTPEENRQRNYLRVIQMQDAALHQNLAA